jgi:hypothetical protein
MNTASLIFFSQDRNCNIFPLPFQLETYFAKRILILLTHSDAFVYVINGANVG